MKRLEDHEQPADGIARGTGPPFYEAFLGDISWRRLRKAYYFFAMLSKRKKGAERENDGARSACTRHDSASRHKMVGGDCYGKERKRDSER
jgi:hypothetical protein